MNISVTISTSVSAAAIFSAEDILGGPPKRKDILTGLYNAHSFHYKADASETKRDGTINFHKRATVEVGSGAHRPGSFFFFAARFFVFRIFFQPRTNIGMEERLSRLNPRCIV